MSAVFTSKGEAKKARGKTRELSYGSQVEKTHSDVWKGETSAVPVMWWIEDD